MLKHSHSGIRWIVLILLIAAIVNAFMKWQGGKEFKDSDKKLNLFALTGTHIQFLLGLGLYFVSPKVIFSGESMKNAVNRFFLVEHSSMMLLAILLITIGYARSKRQSDSSKKFKTSFIFYLIGLAIILFSIPWPGGNLGGSWF